MASFRKREDILGTFRDGDEVGWDEEFNFLIEEDSVRISELMGKIRRDGIQDPILLGDDGRIWDGHRRLLVARILNIELIPVELSRDR